MNDTQLKLLAGRFKAMKKLPYFSTAILSLCFQEVPRGSLNTMAVSPRGVLFWDAADVEQLSVEQVATSILHEMMHVLYRHGKLVGERDPALWNLAGDLAINSALKVAGCDMIQNVSGKEMVLPSKFGFDENLSTAAYYDLLRSQQSLKPKNPCCGSGKCGSGAGNKTPGEPEQGEGSSDKKDGSGQNPGQSPGGADGDDNTPGRSDAQWATVALATAQAIKAHNEKARGTMPLGVLAWANAVVEPPRVSWQDKFRSAVRNSTQVTAGMTHTTYNHPSRRQAGLGFGPGHAVLYAYNARKPRILLAIDTSGSMGCDNAIGQAMGEIVGMLKHLNAPIDYMSCDAEVQAKGVTADWRDVFKNLKGGGGTSFRPVFKAIQDMHAKERPSVLVYATDGEGDCPREKPAELNGIDVIWLLCGKNAPAQPWGTNVKVED